MNILNNIGCTHTNTPHPLQYPLIYNPLQEKRILTITWSYKDYGEEDIYVRCIIMRGSVIRDAAKCLSEIKKGKSKDYITKVELYSLR